MHVNMRLRIAAYSSTVGEIKSEREVWASIDQTGFQRDAFRINVAVIQTVMKGGRRSCRCLPYTCCFVKPVLAAFHALNLGKYYDQLTTFLIELFIYLFNFISIQKYSISIIPLILADT